MKRRTFVAAAAVLGAVHGIVACGGSGGAEAAGGQQPGEWNVSPPPMLFAGTAAVVVDLAASLPAGTKRGGEFSVDASGARLPTGVTLSSSGILSVTATAVVGVTVGVVFRYTEPA